MSFVAYVFIQCISITKWIFYLLVHSMQHCWDDFAAYTPTPGGRFHMKELYWSLVRSRIAPQE